MLFRSNFAAEALLLGILDNPSGLHEPTCFLAQMMRTQTNVTLTKLQTYLELIQGVKKPSYISFEGCLHRYPSTPLAKYEEMLEYLIYETRGIVAENVKEVISQQLKLESGNSVASAEGVDSVFNNSGIASASASRSGGADFDNQIQQLAYKIEKKYSELSTFNQLSTGIALPIPTHNDVLQSFGYTEDIDPYQKQEIIENMHLKLQEFQIFGGKSKTKDRKSTRLNSSH